MKTLNFELTKDIFNEFALSNEEMIYVRGGDGEPQPIPTPPPIII
ncbi:MAG: hypothetical protein WC854_10680 [Bacteroidales bacterium]